MKLSTILVMKAELLMPGSWETNPDSSTMQKAAMKTFNQVWSLMKEGSLWFCTLKKISKKAKNSSSTMMLVGIYLPTFLESTTTSKRVRKNDKL